MADAPAALDRLVVAPEPVGEDGLAQIVRHPLVGRGPGADRVAAGPGLADERTSGGPAADRTSVAGPGLADDRISVADLASVADRGSAADRTSVAGPGLAVRTSADLGLAADRTSVADRGLAADRTSVVDLGSVGQASRPSLPPDRTSAAGRESAADPV